MENFRSNFDSAIKQSTNFRFLSLPFCHFRIIQLLLQCHSNVIKHFQLLLYLLLLIIDTDYCQITIHSNLRSVQNRER